MLRLSYDLHFLHGQQLPQWLNLRRLLFWIPFSRRHGPYDLRGKLPQLPPSSFLNLRLLRKRNLLLQQRMSIQLQHQRI